MTRSAPDRIKDGFDEYPHIYRGHSVDWIMDSHQGATWYMHIVKDENGTEITPDDGISTSRDYTEGWIDGYIMAASTSTTRNP